MYTVYKAIVPKRFLGRSVILVALWSILEKYISLIEIDMFLR